VDKERVKGTAVYQHKVRHTFTLLGLPTIRAEVHAKGDNMVIAARLWDVSHGKQLLVSRGEYRLTNDQTGDVTFQLDGNGYPFRKGHYGKVEILGFDKGYLSPLLKAASVKLTDVQIELPTRERASRKLGLVKPKLAR